MAKRRLLMDKGKAIYRVRVVKSPIHQEFRGLRVEVATPNMSGLKPFSDIPCPSFDKPYYICYFGSYESWEYLERKWPSIWRAIQAMGFSSVQQIQSTPTEDDVVEEVPGESAELVNEPQTQKDRPQHNDGSQHATRQEGQNESE